MSRSPRQSAEDYIGAWMRMHQCHKRKVTLLRIDSRARVTAAAGPMTRACARHEQREIKSFSARRPGVRAVSVMVLTSSCKAEQPGSYRPHIERIADIPRAVRNEFDAPPPVPNSAR